MPKRTFPRILVNFPFSVNFGFSHGQSGYGTWIWNFKWGDSLMKIMYLELSVKMYLKKSKIYQGIFFPSEFLVSTHRWLPIHTIPSASHISPKANVKVFFFNNCPLPYACPSALYKLLDPINISSSNIQKNDTKGVRATVTSRDM